jgi:hypothetical protein
LDASIIPKEEFGLFDGCFLFISELFFVVKIPPEF